MSAVTCAWMQERAPELALGVLHGAERAEALLHVSGCVPCQALVIELTEVADALPLAVPEAEPSAGFGRRAVTAMRGNRRRALRRRVAVIAATAAAAAIVSVALVRIIDASRELPTQAAAPVLRSFSMRTNDGTVVGQTVVSGRAPASLVVNVDYAVPDGVYTLQLRRTGAVPSPIGTMHVDRGRGTWTGKASIRLGESSLAMVDGTGAPVCSATLDRASVS